MMCRALLVESNESHRENADSPLVPNRPEGWEVELG
jgi:hypothetical protein